MSRGLFGIGSDHELDAFESYDQQFDEPREPPTCKHCGKRGLEWVHTGERWRLMDGRKFHVCSNDNAIDDFEVLG